MQCYAAFGWSDRFRLWCNPVEPGQSFTESGYRLARVLWLFYLSKVCANAMGVGQLVTRQH